MYPFKWLPPLLRSTTVGILGSVTSVRKPLLKGMKSLASLQVMYTPEIQHRPPKISIFGRKPLFSVSMTNFHAVMLVLGEWNLM